MADVGSKRHELSDHERLLDSVRAHQVANRDAAMTAKMLGAIAISSFGAVLGVMAREALLAETLEESREGLVLMLAVVVGAIGICLLVRGYVSWTSDGRRGFALWRSNHPRALRLVRSGVGLASCACVVIVGLTVRSFSGEAILILSIGAASMLFYSLGSWFLHDPPPAVLEQTAIEFAYSGPGEVRLAIADTQRMVHDLGNQFDELCELVRAQATALEGQQGTDRNPMSRAKQPASYWRRLRTLIGLERW